MMPQNLPHSFDSVKDLPLVVDLDGTLVLRDTLKDLFLDMAQRCPWNFLKVPYWYARGGRPFVKHHLARYLQVRPENLHFHEALLAMLTLEKERGRYLILATGANEKIAQQIATHIGFFDAALGSTLTKNLTGPRKAELLISLYGEHGFLYAGNAKIDAHVWMKSAGIIVVNPDPGVEDIARKIAEDHDLPLCLFDEN